MTLSTSPSALIVKVALGDELDAHDGIVVEEPVRFLPLYRLGR